jgi:hypothetical protein
VRSKDTLANQPQPRRRKKYLRPGHSEPYANIKSAHPEIHAAMVQALTFRNDPKLLSYIATYEAKLTKNFQINLNMLQKLQSLRQPVLAKEKTMTAAA